MESELVMTAVIDDARRLITGIENEEVTKEESAIQSKRLANLLLTIQKQIKGNEVSRLKRLRGNLEMVSVLKDYEPIVAKSYLEGAYTELLMSRKNIYG